MFLKLTTQIKDGSIEPRLVAVSDISVVKPASAHTAPAKTCISLKSQPEFPIWAIEDQNEIETAIMHMGIDMAPHSRCLKKPSTAGAR